MINNLIEYQNEIEEQSEAKNDQENEELWGIISLHESYLGKVLLNVINFKLYIKTIELSFEPDNGKFLIKNLHYKIDKEGYHEISISRWLFFKKNMLVRMIIIY